MTVLEEYLASMEPEFLEMFRKLRNELFQKREEFVPTNSWSRPPEYHTVKSGDWNFHLQTDRSKRWVIKVRHNSLQWEKCEKFWYMWKDFPPADLVAYRGGKVLEKVGVMVVLGS